MNAQWLAAQFDLYPSHSKSDLARALGLEPPAISKILGGMRKISAEEYITMRQFFGLPTNEGAHAAHDYTLNPLTRADGFEERIHNQDSTGADSWVIPAKVLGQRTDASADKIKVFENCETLMEPDFKRVNSLWWIPATYTHLHPAYLFCMTGLVICCAPVHLLPNLIRQAWKFLQPARAFKPRHSYLPMWILPDA